MTHTPDDPDNPGQCGSGAGGEGAGRKLDEDAAWRESVAHWDDATAPDPVIDRGPTEADADQGRDTGPVIEPDIHNPMADDERLRGLFRPAWDDPLDSEASWNDEGHFVPPTPPPMPVLDPRRRLAWAGLFGSPLLMLLVVVLGWHLPDWLMFLLAVGFAGGFIYLVATMPKRRPGDGSGDDGAVV